MKSIFWRLCILVLCIYVRSSFSLTDDTCVDTVSNMDRLMVTWKPRNSDTNMTLTVKRCRQVASLKPSEYNVLCRQKEVKERCCATCAKLEACKNNASDANPMVISWRSALSYGDDGLDRVTITRCQLLKTRFKIFCRRVAKERCCETCRRLRGLRCVDDFRTPDQVVRNHENKFTDCKKYVKEDPCRCHAPDTKKHCCESCKNIDTAARDCDCRNKFDRILRPGYSMTATVKYTVNFKTYELFEGDISDCAMVGEFFPALCGNNIIGAVFCCKSCKDIDHNCVDNTFFTFNVTHGSSSCQNCTCHDIRKTSKQLMKRACQQNLESLNGDVTVRNACCHQCKRLGFDVPENYTTDSNLSFLGDISFIEEESPIATLSPDVGAVGFPAQTVIANATRGPDATASSVKDPTDDSDRQKKTEDTDNFEFFIIS